MVLTKYTEIKSHRFMCAKVHTYFPQLVCVCLTPHKFIDISKTKNSFILILCFPYLKCLQENMCETTHISVSKYFYILRYTHSLVSNILCKVFKVRRKCVEDFFHADFHQRLRFTVNFYEVKFIKV